MHLKSLAAALVLTLAATSQASAECPAGSQQMRVLRGDTCHAIIVKYFDKSFKQFKSLNPRVNCNDLFIGMPYCR